MPEASAQPAVVATSRRESSLPHTTLDEDKTGADTTMTFVDLCDTPEDHARLARFFHELFVSGFPDPDERESLTTLQQNLIKRTEGFYGVNNYRIVLGLDGDVPVAACIADYMAESNCGAIEYILVSEDRRGEGLGRRIHDYTVGLLLGDANAAGKTELNAIMVEINDPYKVSAESDNADPFDRVMMWHKWGYQRLRFPYEQPALSKAQAPVTCLLLGIKALHPALQDIYPATLARQMVVDYLVWANRFDAFDTDPFYRQMTAYADARSSVPLERLDTYIGRNPDKPLTVRAIVEVDDPEYGAMVAVYLRAFGEGEEAVPPQHFSRALDAYRKQHTRYHIWTFSDRANRSAAGMATFFAMPQVGFVGYLVLEAPLCGRGLTRVALKRIEQQMIRDHADIRYLYLECARDSPQQAVFRAVGFRELDVAYHQPPLCDDANRMTMVGPAMALMCKAMGDSINQDLPGQEETRKHVAQILRTAYGLTDPEQSLCYLLMFGDNLHRDGRTSSDRSLGQG